MTRRTPTDGRGTWSGRPLDPMTSWPCCSRRQLSGPWPAVGPPRLSIGGSGRPSSAGPMSTAPGAFCAPRRSLFKRVSRNGPGNCWLRRPRLLPDAPSRASSRALLGAIEMRHGSPEAAYHLLLEAAKDLAAHDPSAALDSLVLAGEAATFLGDPRLTQEVSGLATNLRDTGATVDGSVVDLLVGLGKLFEGNWSEGSRILAGVIDESVVSAEYDDVLRSGRAAMYLGRLGRRPHAVCAGGVPGPRQLQRRPARADAGSSGLHRTAPRSAPGRRDPRARRAAAGR